MLSKDFTLLVYEKLMRSLIRSGYKIFSYEDFLSSNQTKDKYVILRHDVDKLPFNALKMAKLEKNLNIKSTYYFRIVKGSNNPKVIKEIASLGHEIGYHYEDLTLAKGNYKIAIKLFEENLTYFRKFYDVKTVVYHGSPLTKWNNKDIWKKYNYNDFNVIAEPFFDIDFSKTLYLTDTGRSWNGRKFSVRDRVNMNSENKPYNSTFEIINAIEKNTIQNRIHINVHSQRWHTNFISWLWELCFQNVKNIIKKYFFVKS